MEVDATSPMRHEEEMMSEKAVAADYDARALQQQQQEAEAKGWGITFETSNANVKSVGLLRP